MKKSIAGFIHMFGWLFMLLAASEINLPVTLEAELIIRIVSAGMTAVCFYISSYLLSGEGRSYEMPEMRWENDHGLLQPGKSDGDLRFYLPVRQDPDF